MEFIKYLICNILKFIQKMIFVLPIKKNKIMFFPCNGNYYCNLKYIYLSLKKYNDKYDIVWVLKNKSFKYVGENVHVCKINSLLFFWHALTSKCIIFNCGFKSYIYKRKKQVYIETWHGGGAYKKIGLSIRRTKGKFLRKRLIISNDSIDYIISSSKGFTHAFKKDNEIENAVFCPFGMPRNDIFFDNRKMKRIKEKVKSRFNIKNKKIVMYAPTFRDNFFYNDLDFTRVLDVLECKYESEFVLFLRCHPHLKNNIFEKCTFSENVIDVSQYYDMQELLCAVDILITDYSSSMWDCSLMYKPCFIYANDLNSYKNERNFHIPISKWPFPVSTNNQQLVDNIINFNITEYKSAVELHHKFLESYEDGHAGERVCNLIEKICTDEVQ